MSEVRPTYDDEIDLLEFFETLWDGKWLISAFVVLATLIGLGYSQVAQPKYSVSVPYSVNIYAVSVTQLCTSSFDCMESQTIKRFLSLIGNSWSKEKKSSTLYFSTSAPSEQSDYEVQLKQASTALTNEVFLDARTELAFIQTELTDPLLNTEKVATHMLIAKRIVQSIDNGRSAITFGSVSVVKASPKLPLILGLSVASGWMIGVFLIIIRNTIKKRKKQLAK